MLKILICIGIVSVKKQISLSFALDSKFKKKFVSKVLVVIFGVIPVMFNSYLKNVSLNIIPYKILQIYTLK